MSILGGRSRLRVPTGQVYGIAARALWDRTVSPIWAKVEDRILRPRHPWVRGLRCPPGALTISGRGHSTNRQRRALRLRGIGRGQDIVIVGAGEGAEVLDWYPLTPRSILAGDVRDMTNAWRIIERDAHRRGIRVRFRIMDGCSLPLSDESVDLVVSHTVLEHIIDVRAHLAEVRRVLRTGGYYFCVYGPAWPSYEGPHCDSQGYEHLRVPFEEWQAVARDRVAHRDNYMYEIPSFNEWPYSEYDRVLPNFFETEVLTLYLSRGGLEYRRTRSEEWARLLEATSFSEPDLLCKGAIVLLRKTAEPTTSPGRPL